MTDTTLSLDAPAENRLAATRERARFLMDLYGLKDWTFGFDRRKKRLGVCHFPTWGRPGRIQLSAHFVLLNPPEVVEDTIRHEIAHALAGPEAGHGPVWKLWCLTLGAKPQACNEGEALMPKGPWRATCPSCGKEFNRFK